MKNVLLPRALAIQGMVSLTKSSVEDLSPSVLTKSIVVQCIIFC